MNQIMKAEYIQPEISVLKVCGKEFLMDNIGVVTGSKAGKINDGKWDDSDAKERGTDFNEKEITYGNIW